MKYMKPIVAMSILLIVSGALALVFFRDVQTGVVTPPPSAAELTAARSAAPALPVPAENTIQKTNETQVVSGEPANLSIPSINLNLAITPGVYNAQTQKWTLTLDKAQHAVMTPAPNTEGGNTFIYGHYRKGVFSTLHTIEPGAQAIVTTRSGKTFTYTLASRRVVAPEQSEGIFDYQGKPILTLQTCTGLLFQNRQLFTFNLESAS